MTWYRIRILIYQKCKALMFEAFYFNASQHHMNNFYQNMPFINLKSSFILYNNNDGLSPHVRNKQSFWCSLNCCFRNFCLLYLSFWLIRDLIKCIRALPWYNIFKSVNIQKTLFSFYNRERESKFTCIVLDMRLDICTDNKDKAPVVLHNLDRFWFVWYCPEYILFHQMPLTLYCLT